MPLQPPSFPIGDHPDVGAVADWCEFVALARTNAFKRGDLKSAISLENLADGEAVEQDVWYELERRAELFGNRWPLRVTGLRLSRRSPSPVPLSLYRFFCLLGIGILDASDRTLFELVITQLLVPLTGHPALHIGAPASVGMDPSFRERVKFYATDSGLLKTEIKSSPLPTDKDLGVDAVTWLPFSDNRGAYLHFLAQCSTGSDWEGKLHDIDLEVWKDHVHWGVTPVRIFAVPFVITLPEAKWVRTSHKGGLILDRPRLVELATRVRLPSSLISELTTRVNTLAAA
jgi:hypothetical protein